MKRLRWPWSRARRSTPVDPWYGIEYLRHAAEIEGISRTFEFLRRSGMTISGEVVESVIDEVLDVHEASIAAEYETDESARRRASRFVAIVHAAYVLLDIRPISVLGLLDVVKRDVISYAPNLVSTALDNARHKERVRVMMEINKAAGLDKTKPPRPEPTEH